MKPAMALLHANMGLLTAVTSTSPSHSTATSTDYPKLESGGGSVPAHSDQFSYTSSHLSPNGEFPSPGQYSFDTHYYPGQHSASTSPATYASGNLDAQSQEFGFGIGNSSGLWSYWECSSIMVYHQTKDENNIRIKHSQFLIKHDIFKVITILDMMVNHRSSSGQLMAPTFIPKKE